MRFKTDENLHPQAAAVLRDHGHEVTTIWDQNLRGAADQAVIEICRDEKRALVTFDLDFADIRAYPPQKYFGIVVLRLNNQSRKSAIDSIKLLLPLLEEHPLIGRLWIVDEQNVRIRVGD